MTDVIGFDLAQITSGENRSNPRPGSPQPPLVATGQPHVAIGVLGEHAHTLTAEGFDASEDGTGRGTPIIAATLTAGVSSKGVSAPGRRQEDETNLVPVTIPIDLRNATRTDADDTASTGIGQHGDPASTIGTSAPQAVGSATSVRRLTPLECERLQGLPDAWTAISVRDDGTVVHQSDSARYKQCGNGGAVPVMRWICERIAARA